MSETVVTLGMHRSGTSAVARGLAVLGVALGEHLIAGAADNPKGFWEDRDIVALNERLLALFGMRWDSVRQIDAALFASSLVSPVREEAVALLGAHFGAFSRWGFKDPRTARLLPFWQGVFDELGIGSRYVIVIREPSSVARSLARRNGFSYEKSYLLWLGHIIDALRYTAGSPRTVIDYDCLIDEPKAQFERLAAFLGVAYEAIPEAAVAEYVEGFLDADLRHTVAGDTSLPASDVGRLALESYQALERVARGVWEIDAAPFCRAWALVQSKFDHLQPLLDHIDALDDVVQNALRCEIEALADANRLRGAEIVRLEKEVQTCMGELRRLERGVLERREKIVQLEQELHKRGLEIARLKGLSGDRAAEIDRLAASLREREEWLADLRDKVASQCEEIAAWHAEVERLRADLRDKVASQREEIAAWHAEVERLRAVNAALQADLQFLGVKHSNTENRLNVLLGSRSWRLTAPLRMMKRGVLTLVWRGSHRLRSACRQALQRLWLAGRFLFRCLPLSTKGKMRLKRILFRVYDAVFLDADSVRNLATLHQLARGRQQYLLQRKPPCEAMSAPAAGAQLLDISAVSYNSGRWVPSFIDSLVAQQYPLDRIRLIVVEHGSDAETLALWERARAQYGARFRGFDIYQRKNRGFGAGHNFALAQSDAPFVLVTNIDLEFAPDALATVMATAWADDADVASWELRQKPYEHPKYYDPVTLETGWSSHACVLLRREAFRAVGGYERRIFMYGEDVELSYRLRDRGYRIKYCPKATVWHFSYEQPHQVKPLQFSGSTLANSYIRLRYGAVSDILRIPSMYGSLLCKALGVPGGNRAVMKNIAKIVLHTPYFLSTRKRSKQHFSFFGWDYELRRDGAFYRYKEDNAPRQPLVSVIMRTYRAREFWLREAVASVVNQTYPQIELIVIEDGGETVKPLIDSIRQARPSLNLSYQGLPKKGRAVSGNVGLSLARGDFLMFLDDDDLLFADHIEVLVDELCADPTIAAAYALTWEVETRLTYEPSRPYEELIHRTPHVFRQEFSRDVLKHHNYIPIQALLFKRELYEKYGGFDESMEYLEDWNLWTKYSSQEEFKYIEKTTSYFRTPYDLDERVRRQHLLDSYYQIAIHKQNEFYQSLMVKNEIKD